MKSVLLALLDENRERIAPATVESRVGNHRDVVGAPYARSGEYEELQSTSRRTGEWIRQAEASRVDQAVRELSPHRPRRPLLAR
jgi:hypothetical protein